MKTVRELLLVRRGRAYLAPFDGPPSERPTKEHVRALAIELGGLGWAVGAALEKRLLVTSLDELTAFHRFAAQKIADTYGDGEDVKFEPLFRSFPHGIPADTFDLWVRKVLVHFAQGEQQSCLFCGRTGTTHVLNPCHHVVCDVCFDGASYSACPVCEHRVDRSSPFFQPSVPLPPPDERVSFKVVDLGDDFETDARKLFESLLARTQALSPDDRDALVSIVTELRSRVIAWLPATIPVKENVALVLGTLLRECAPEDVLPVAKRFLRTATDVLRVLEVLAGGDGGLLHDVVQARTRRDDRRWSARTLKMASRQATEDIVVSIKVHRYKRVGRISRPIRRALFSILESFDRDALVEDMLRHDARWVGLGELLHPHEWAARYPNVARAFSILRKRAPDGTPAEAFQTFYGKVESARLAGDTQAMLALLRGRPGELARRFDLLLRMGDGAVGEAFGQSIPKLATPMLAQLRSYLPTRVAPAQLRMYWPKGDVARGVIAKDERAPLPQPAIDAAVSAITGELLARFAQKQAFRDALIDDALADVIAPFNERTAARSAVALPRGSRIAVPEGKVLRLFLHWCEPEGGRNTDLDLSVGFYDSDWKYVGVCSYYQLQFGDVAVSSGDMRSAPPPDGATEYVDVHRDRALAAGVRFAVGVVNAYAGLPFSMLDRAFAGLMLRDDVEGRHFDPRTVALKFALDGDNGVFLPFVVDLRDSVLHWLDVHHKGQFAMNNVRTSNGAITTIAPASIAYFGSGVRPSVRDLALLHAAARCQRVTLRGELVRQFVRRAGESSAEFHTRLVRDEADEPRARLPAFDEPVLAALHQGDVALPEGSAAYALFRERTAATLSASDFVA